MAEVEIRYSPSEKQNDFHSSRAYETLFIGGRGSGKTYAGVMEGYILSLEYPGNAGLIVRKHFSDLIDTTIATWKKLIPPECYEINAQTHIITVHTGKGKPDSIIYYRGLDNTENINKSRGLETGWQLWDQAEECTQEDIDEALPCQRHKLPNGSLPYYRVMYLANPTRSHIVTKFTQNLDDTMKLIQVSTLDNPYQADGYADRLAQLYKFRPELYKAMVLGEIIIADEPDIVIPYHKIELAMRRTDKLAFFDKKLVSIDVSREGNDNTVIYGWDGCKIVGQDIYGKKDLDVTAARAISMLKRIGANCIIWDADGIGGGLMSNFKNLVSEGISFIEFHGSGKSDNEMYYNARAQAYFEAAELFNNDLLSVPEDPILRSELSSVHYEYKLGKMIVEEKAKIKEKLRRSPDRADAFVYGVYALKRAPSMHIQQAVVKGTMGEFIKGFDEADEADEFISEEVIGNHNTSKW